MTKTARILVTVLGGWFGLHKYIDGKIGMGLLYTITGGLFYIGWIYDCVKACTARDSSSPGLSSEDHTHWQKYDMDSLEGIHSIPVPAKNYNTGDPTKDCIYYVLQRKATEHKKNGHMDLAIACLRKSNELSDYEKRPLLLEKEYFRLIKYISQTGDLALAEAEKQKIYERHPEFKDRRISNLIRIKDTLKKTTEWKNDLVIISTPSSCPVCGKYNRKIYSISGKNKQYPKLPVEISQQGGFCPSCYLEISSYFEDISSKS